jgi:hypothetical protein
VEFIIGRRFALTRWLHPGYDIFVFLELKLDNFGFSDYVRAVPFLQGGGSRSSRYVGRDAMDVDALLTNSAEADGESVWS